MVSWASLPAQPKLQKALSYERFSIPPSPVTPLPMIVAMAASHLPTLDTTLSLAKQGHTTTAVGRRRIPVEPWWIAWSCCHASGRSSSGESNPCLDWFFTVQIQRQCRNIFEIRWQYMLIIWFLQSSGSGTSALCDRCRCFSSSAGGG